MSPSSRCIDNYPAMHFKSVPAENIPDLDAGNPISLLNEFENLEIICSISTGIHG
jgi:hypothetical protein